MKKENLKSLFMVHPSTRYLALKIFKKIFPYIKKTERKHYMDIVTLIYLHLKPDLNEESWLNGTKSEQTSNEEEKEEKIEKLKKKEEKELQNEEEQSLSQYISILMNSIHLDESFKQNYQSFVKDEVYSNPQAKVLLRYDSVEDLLKNL